MKRLSPTGLGWRARNGERRTAVDLFVSDSRQRSTKSKFIRQTIDIQQCSIVERSPRLASIPFFSWGERSPGELVSLEAKFENDAKIFSECVELCSNNVLTAALQLESNGCCMICKEPNDEPLRRGLSMKHYQQLRAAVRDMTDAEREEFEEIAIENGQSLPSAQGKRTASTNVFADLAAVIKLKHLHNLLRRVAEEPDSCETGDSPPTHPTAADVDAIVRSTKKATPKLPAESKAALKKKRAAE